MFSVLNVNAGNTSWDNTGVVIFYPHRQMHRLIHRVGSLALLYEPTHEPRPRGYFVAGRLTSIQADDEDGLVAVHIRSDGLFMFASPVRFRVRGKLREAGLGVGGRAGMHIRDVSKEDFLGIVTLGFGGVERIPYSLMKAIEEDDPQLWAAEDG